MGLLKKAFCESFAPRESARSLPGRNCSMNGEESHFSAIAERCPMRMSRARGQGLPPRVDSRHRLRPARLGPDRNFLNIPVHHDLLSALRLAVAQCFNLVGKAAIAPSTESLHNRLRNGGIQTLVPFGCQYVPTDKLPELSPHDREELSSLISNSLFCRDSRSHPSNHRPVPM